MTAEPVSKTLSNKYTRVYFEVFILVTLLIWLPGMKIPAYVSPYVALFYFIYRTNSGMALFRLCALFIGFVSFCTLQYGIGTQLRDWDLLPFNYVFSFITYGSFAFLFIIPNRFIEKGFDYLKYAKVLNPLLFIQGLIGILQFSLVHFTGAFNILDGDAVQGSIGLTAFIAGIAGFGNQMYSINVCFLLLMFTPYVLAEKKGYWAFGLALLSILLAGVVHVFICLLGAIGLLMAFFYAKIFIKKIKTIILALISVCILAFAGEVIFPGLSGSASIYYNYLVNEGHSPKNMAINMAFIDIPEQHPDVHLFGVGVGQYSSRSGLICSGRYFATHLGFLPNQTSEPFQLYAEHIWHDYMTRGSVYGGSTMHRPFASILSVYVEFGTLIFLFFLVLFLHFLNKTRKFYFIFERKPLEQQLSLSIGIALVFLLLIGIFENYLETTQALLHGLVILKISYAHLNQLSKSQLNSHGE